MSHHGPKRAMKPEAVDESRESEIVIHADGRIFAFGITRGVVQVLASLPSSRGPGRRVLDRIKTEAGEAAR